MISTRKMNADDAQAVSALLCRSISELCIADHRNEPEVIDRWLANKTPDQLLRWLAQLQSHFVLACIDTTIVGVGCYSAVGEIFLNYVSPEHRFQGVSKRVLAEMESRLVELGIARGKLESTETAHRFYRSADWIDTGAPKTEFGIIGHPMEKAFD